MNATEFSQRAELPPDLVEFLRAGRQFSYEAKDCEAGEVEIRSLDNLKERKAWIDPSELCNFAVWNPHAGQEGYYEVPCISLTSKADAYKPDGLLVWIPQIKLFASCDTGHGVIWLFPGATWEKISQEPVPYLNAQWGMNPEKQALLVPWGLFKFKQGNPYDDSEVITS